MSRTTDLPTEAACVRQLIDDKYAWMRRHAECTQQLLLCQRSIKALMERLDAQIDLHAAMRAELHALMVMSVGVPHEINAPARRRHEQGATR